MTIPNKSLILKGKICPYCEKETEYVQSTEVYDRDYGMIYLCRPCGAWVGVHKGTDAAKGRLANAELRDWKIKAHASFDKLWKRYLQLGTPKHKARNSAYQWLADRMGIEAKDAHIGMFDIEECKNTISLCNNFQSSSQESTKFEPVVKIRLQKTEDLKETDWYRPMPNQRQERAKELMVKWCVDKKVSAVELQPYQIRFSTAEKKIDIFPQSRRYHDIVSNKRGSYHDLIHFLDAQFVLGKNDIHKD